MSSQEEYTLIYWPLAGRGEFVRVILEELKLPYKEIGDWKTVPTILAEVSKSAGFPNFAPPVLKQGKTTNYVDNFDINVMRGSN